MAPTRRTARRSVPMICSTAATVEGYVVWRRLLEAAAELTCMKRAEGERMN
jgi:hypothetical protein